MPKWMKKYLKYWDQKNKQTKEGFKMNDKHHKKISVELTLKEIKSIVFHLQQSIDNYKGSTYLENIQDKLLKSRKG